MSPRAAVRLEALGFRQVYDYKAGKKDWLAAGLPSAGEKSGQARVGDIARSNPPTCRPGETVGRQRERPDVAEWRLCVVTDSDGVVHGLVTQAVLSESSPDRTVDEVMELGPTTIRPSDSIESAHGRLREADVDTVLVTDGFGELIGVFYAIDAEAHLAREE